MKLRVFLRTYGVLLLFAVVVFLRLQANSTPFKVFTSTAFLVGISLSVLLSDKRYIRSLTVQDNHLTINYVDQFFRSKTVQIDRSTISELDLPRWTWYAPVWAPVLDIKAGGEWMPFQVPSKAVLEQLQQQLLLSGMAVAK